ncbi:hypothetical protein BDV11DRAFT_158375 [Aspergillus similis]
MMYLKGPGNLPAGLNWSTLSNYHRVRIIHVIGVDRERQPRHDTILGDTAISRRREFVFQCDISSFLLGDLVLDAVQSQAVQLLDDIVSLSDSNDGSNKVSAPTSRTNFKVV